MRSFSGTGILPSGASTATATAVDGGSNTKTNPYQYGVPSPSSQNLTFDANGNMTSDGTNTYQWDAEDRLIQINYPGTGNNSQFMYDGLGHRVKIVETTGGSTTSTRQFVWCDNTMCEARDAAGTVTAKYFGDGQTIGGSNYYYSVDHLGSIRALTDSTGATRAVYQYDPYGRVTKMQGDLDSDFQYAGYYYHSPSGLSLTLYRTYSPNLGRWLNRDPIGEEGGVNLYAYANNNPTLWTDYLGTQPNDKKKWCSPGPKPRRRQGESEREYVRRVNQWLIDWENYRGAQGQTEDERKLELKGPSNPRVGLPSQPPRYSPPYQVAPPPRFRTPPPSAPPPQFGLPNPAPPPPPQFGSPNPR